MHAHSQLSLEIRPGVAKDSKTFTENLSRKCIKVINKNILNDQNWAMIFPDSFITVKELCTCVRQQCFAARNERDIMSAKRGQVTICFWKFSHNIFLVSHQEVLFGAQACKEIFRGEKHIWEKQTWSNGICLTKALSKNFCFKYMQYRITNPRKHVRTFELQAHLFYCAFLHHASQILHFSQMELFEATVHQTSLLVPFSMSISSFCVSVSHFGDSCHI